MMREDYEKFFEVAKDELPEEYCLLTLHTEEEYEHMLGRVVNGHSIDFSEGHLKEYFGCPYTVGIDIFPLDKLSDDEAEEENRREALVEISQAVSMIGKNGIEAPECRKILANIERTNHVVLHRNKDIIRQLLILSETLYKKFSSKESKYIALMPFWVTHHDHKYDKALFDNTVWMPFEFIHLPVPYRYEEVLRTEYGNYMPINRKGGVHTYPVYSDQEDIVQSRLGNNPFRYTMPRELPDKRVDRSITDRCLAIADTIGKAHARIKYLYDHNEPETAGELLESCQNLAISLGTLIEQRVREAADVVHMLEEYCEHLYEISVDYRGDESISLIDSTINTAVSQLETILKNRKKEILFLPCMADWWDTMEPEWKRITSDFANDVYVMPIPYLIKGYAGDASVMHDDGALFPEYVRLTAIKDYNIEERHPDVIYIQCPYDGQSRAFVIPEFYHSDKIRKYTDELVYIPCFDVKNPEYEDDKKTAAMKVLIEQPAVYYSDRIVLKNAALRDVYLKVLTQITGKDTVNYWEGKIISRDEQQEDASNTDESKKRSAKLPMSWDKRIGNKKVIIFRVSFAFLAEHQEKAIDKIRNSISTIKENGDSIVCIFSPDEALTFNEIDTDNTFYGWYDDWKSILKDVDSDDSMIYDAENKVYDCLDLVSGYYGSGGRLAHVCAEAGLPVMIMSV